MDRQPRDPEVRRPRRGAAGLRVIFKNTSCDDGVENWFEKYNEETEEYEPCSLKNMDRVVAEFVHIEGKTMEFTTNLDFFKEDEDQ